MYMQGDIVIDNNVYLQRDIIFSVLCFFSYLRLWAELSSQPFLAPLLALHATDVVMATI